MFKRIVQFGYLAISVVLLVVLSGCAASIKETHYVLAHDPQTNVSNYFKIDFDGSAEFSRSKFSLGEYDRLAVSRLFSEASLRGEYLATDIAVYDESGTRIKDLSSEINKLKVTEDKERTDRLKRLNEGIAYEIGIYEVLINNKKDIYKQYKSLLDNAEKSRETGESKLNKQKLDEASSALARALGMVSTIRLLMKGDNIVRHFDPDGNEVDVRNKSLLVFVATDTSQFTRAISQLVESESATNNIIKTILGPKIVEQQLLEKQVESSNNIYTALTTRMFDLIDTSNSTDEQKVAVKTMAKEIANRSRAFENAEEIKWFATTIGR